MNPGHAAMGETAEVVEPVSQFRADVRVPGDKSIAHRALMLAAIADGQSHLEGIPDGADVAATIACLRALGASLTLQGASTVVEGGGIGLLKSPSRELDCANSGTTMRLLAGLLAGSRVSAMLVGDQSLQRRPMDRVAAPLRRMGARIRTQDGHAPISIEGSQLAGIEHRLDRPSAQVKSALLLAGLQADGPTATIEPVATRDHTERLLAAMGALIERDANRVRVKPRRGPLRALNLSIPGDFSSAAFLLGAAALRPGWTATVRDVGLNPSRTAFLTALKAMGATVEVEIDEPTALEPRGIVRVRGSGLRALAMDAEFVSQAIDEIPVLLAVASQAGGVTHVTGAGELRVKESDRLMAMANGLRQMGVKLEERPDGISVEGPTRLRGAEVSSSGDHRVAMALAVAALAAHGPTTIQDAACVSISYPDFFQALRMATA